MRRSNQIVIAGCSVVWLLIIGVYLANPSGSATWDPRGRLFGYVPYKIRADGMSPTLRVGDVALAKTFVYANAEPQHSDVVVFLSPVDPGSEWVKRVIGIPGDEIEIQDGTVYVNDEVLNEPYLGGVIATKSYSLELAKLTVPSGHYFVMGDNRDNSHDSRHWGSVPRENVVGRLDVLLQAGAAE